MGGLIYTIPVQYFDLLHHSDTWGMFLSFQTESLKELTMIAMVKYRPQSNGDVPYWHLINKALPETLTYGDLNRHDYM